MSPAIQAEAESIAKHGARVAEAKAVLGQYRNPFGHKQYFMLLFLGLATGASLSQVPKFGSWFVGAAAWAALFIAAQTFRECLDLRRRLDAALVLLAGQGGL